jgi:hypothetical protein
VMAVVGNDSTPALAYHWDFGDGVSAEGPSVDHAYTRNGSSNPELFNYDSGHDQDHIRRLSMPAA